MRAVAVHPGKPNTVHVRDVPDPRLADQPHPHVCRIPEGRAVLVRTLQIGVDATDREINEALYGNAPPGGVHNDINTRDKLKRYDLDLFTLIDDVYRKPEWRYVRYDRRSR